MILELENSLEWSNVASLPVMPKSSSISIVHSSTLSVTSMREIANTMQSGRFLPAIVRLERHSSVSSVGTQLDAVDMTSSDDSSGNYVAFCRYTSNENGLDDNQNVTYPDCNDPMVKKHADDAMLVWMTAFRTQRRVAFKTVDNRYLTVPIDTAYQFNVIKNVGRSNSVSGSSTLVSLKEVIEILSAPGGTFQVSVVMETGEIADKDSQLASFGRLQLVGYFDAPYLAGRQIKVDYTGKMGLGEVICLPINSCGMLNVATGLKRQPIIEFRQLKESLGKLNDELVSDSETDDIRSPWLITPKATTKVDLNDLQYIKPDVRLSAVPISKQSKPPFQPVEPPPRRKYAIYNKSASLSGTASQALPDTGKLNSGESTGKSTTVSGQRLPDDNIEMMIPTCGQSVHDNEHQKNRYSHDLNCKCPASDVNITHRSCSMSSMTSSPSVTNEVHHRSSKSSAQASDPSTLVAPDSDSLTFHRLQSPSCNIRKDVLARRSVLAKDMSSAGSLTPHKVTSQRVSSFSLQHRDPDPFDSVKQRFSSPSVGHRIDIKHDRVAYLAVSTDWQQRDAKSLPCSPATARAETKTATTVIANKTSADENEKTVILPVCKAKSGISGNFLLRTAETECVSSLANPQIAKIPTSNTDPGLDITLKTASETSDKRTVCKEVPRNNEAVGSSSIIKTADAIISLTHTKTFTADNATYTGKMNGVNSEKSRVEDVLEQSIVNPYLCLLPDDYIDGSEENSTATDAQPGQVIDSPRRRLSSSLSSVDGIRLYKSRPYSASMCNINRPLPDIPPPTDSLENIDKPISGNRRLFSASIGSLPAKPFKKLMNLVNKRKNRRSTCVRFDSTDSAFSSEETTGDDDHFDSVSQINRTIGGGHIYEPLRRNASAEQCESTSNSFEQSDSSRVSGFGRWSTAGDIPTDIQQFTVSEIADCLRLLKMERYAEVFAAQDVDGALLLTIDEELLQDSFGMSGLEAKKIVQFAKNGWRPRT